MAAGHALAGRTGNAAEAGRRTRREFLGAAAGAGGAVLVGAGRAGAGGRAGPGRSVAVLGGGVAGLSAAQELAERGYLVTVYERETALGGKARSKYVPGSGTGGRRPLPGEHGFRFFPGFYRNLPDTMRRIPLPDGGGSVHDNLMNATDGLVVRTGGRPDLTVPFRTLLAPPDPATLLPDALLRNLTASLDTVLHLPPTEVAYFANRLLVHLTSCDQRRFGQWERVPWWDFIRADRMSRDYRHLLGTGMTRNLVAIKAEVASTRTVARIIQAFLCDIVSRGNDGEPDRVLNAPTDEAWITPWVRHLRSLGVRFVLGGEVREVLYGDGRVTGVRLGSPLGGADRRVTADHYLSAMPVEHARATWGRELRAADGRLARCDRLQTDWMVGVQYFLRTRTPIVHGHTDHIDSPWALTTISQAQFWPGRDFRADYGDGRVADCLSVCVSEWRKPGILYGKPAIRCTREEVAREVWAQLKSGLNDTGRRVLDDADVHTWFIDPAVTGLGGPSPVNREQLFIHPVGTWFDRPPSRTAVPNFFLAGDYVATDVDLATMEGANESARRAVNALLEADGSPAPPCRVWPLYRPPELEPFHRQDRARYEAGRPNVFDLG
ncbi:MULTISPECIES: hydroxysqualene dehydroxylase [Streptomyces]|uniref:hydroxysqualene dehydroxylase n=1 Tax=Streptomyces TaxID=1883 RepID=UPI00163CABC0|nr:MULTISPECIES: FAD-dependent oxidoreductase [Streptomyces]MBC2879496.1 FAD-dependent oxidoreductase [Streptomyces sp. TYQ1024]UBI40906.1 FAD-dependent oxidoreductase [Streptomyces mobaraensis]UKW33384.1 FAD-dependent oxidoreductase [Streptomyces sp. TYQ1024]UKW33865.1 FAD-dependent oxidoreductase [Streptomyces sp. TYQ1024]